tara:strand:+ start:1227 stop:1391 length:165 start_codon:yes stop_codon:yes gene_type:complete
MEIEIKWAVLLIESKLSEYGKEQFHKMCCESKLNMVFDAMTSEIFDEVFPTNYA